MPVYNWKKVDAGLFHTFHGSWIARLHETLMNGLLPKGYYALTESYLKGSTPDILTFRRSSSSEFKDDLHRGQTVRTQRPKAFYTTSLEDDHYLSKQRHIVVRDRKSRRVVAVIEIVSPSNKRSSLEVDQFVFKSLELLKTGVNLVIIDLLPPTKACPISFHNQIWEYWHGICDFAPPRNKKLSVISYDATDMPEVFLEPIGIGDNLPSSPLFLLEKTSIELPLEETANHVMKFIPFDV